ncbi:MAG: hypothetical protein ACRCSS_17310 [Shewanella sp.]
MTNYASELTRDSEKWDNRELGASMDHVVVASEEETAALDEILALQAISIRLQKNLIKDLKSIAKSYEIGYQPMIRDLLQRFVRAEQKKQLQKQIDILNEQDKAQSDIPPITEFIEEIRAKA